MARYDLEAFQIPNAGISAATIVDFKDTMLEAVTEAPLQAFLEKVPLVWRCLLPKCRLAWAIPKPQLGAEYVPDFLLAYQNSTGMQWILVELEKPNKRPLTKAGTPTSSLTQARSQVADWRNWLTDNVSYARGTLGLSGIRGDCPAWIVLGRRDMIDLKHIVRYSQLSTPADTVMTYDRILEAMITARGLAK